MEVRTVFLFLLCTHDFDTLLDVLPVCELCITLLPRTAVQLQQPRVSVNDSMNYSQWNARITVIAETPNSRPRRGMSL